MIARAAVAALGLLALAGPAAATDAFDPAAAGVERPTERWARLEMLEDAHEAMVQEEFGPLSAHTDPEVVAGFGDDATPPSSRFLLHYEAGWDEATVETPVLLVHGAGLTANHCFTDRPIEQPYPGLAAKLAASGRAVFAVTFAHMHGDNPLQAEAVADAIARIRHLTGAEQVDLVAHSKGGMACRLYVSDMNPGWGTRYRDDVRRYVMLGAPNGGIDVSFAYPNLNYWILENRSSAPLSWGRCLYYGRWVDYPERRIDSGAFRGQPQMVARWDRRYGRTTAEGQYDVDATYEGGRGTVSVGPGIEAVIARGGNMIAALDRKGVDPDVELALLAGTSPWIMHMVGERRGPSDGLLLVASALADEGLTRRGADVVRKDTLHLNHLQLVYEPRANDWVLEALEQ